MRKRERAEKRSWTLKDKRILRKIRREDLKEILAGRGFRRIKPDKPNGDKEEYAKGENNRERYHLQVYYKPRPLSMRFSLHVDYDIQTGNKINDFGHKCRVTGPDIRKELIGIEYAIKEWYDGWLL